MSSRVDITGEGWTYGAEHELADWDSHAAMPTGGFQRAPDHTVVNSNGVAAQPNNSVYRWGGEINTPPTEDPAGQARWLQIIKTHYAVHAPRVNHRSNLHVHVRVPGLKDNLRLLKQMQRYIHEHLPGMLPLVQEIPPGTTPAECKRAKRRKVSHQTFLTESRLAHQLKAITLKDFFEREVPRSKAGAVMWHAQPRVCVNLRQLLQTNTVEFRHFAGTLDEGELLTCVNWCRDFLLAAFTDRPAHELYCWWEAELTEKYTAPFPVFPEFNEVREIGYQATASNIGVPREEILANIKAIERGWHHFKEYRPTHYRAAAQRAGVVPWERMSQPAGRGGAGPRSGSRPCKVARAEGLRPH